MFQLLKQFNAYFFDCYFYSKKQLYFDRFFSCKDEIKANKDKWNT